MIVKYATSEDQQRAADLLFEAMGEAIDGCSLPEAVALLVSQRENARNAHAATQERCEKLEKALEFYANKEGWEDVESGIGTLPGETIDYGLTAREALREEVK